MSQLPCRMGRLDRMARLGRPGRLGQATSVTRSIRNSRSRLGQTSSRASLLLPSPFTLLLALFLMVNPSARADGGHIALHATTGAYTVTLFTTPEPLIAGPCDLSLLVQSSAETSSSAASPAMVSDVAVQATLRRGGSVPGHGPDSSSLTFPLTREAATNKLLLAATESLQPGDYTLTLRVGPPGHPDQNVLFVTHLFVRQNHQRRTTVLFAILVPVAAILLFVVNQWARRQAALRRAHI